MIANVAKVFQRRLYDLLTSRAGLIFILTSFLVLIVSLLHFGEILFQWSSERYHALGPPAASADNLGGRSFLEQLCPSMPVDVVYTWVNGSDPRLLADLVRFQRIFAEEERLAKLAATTKADANSSGAPLPPKCIWNNCNLFSGRQLFRCPSSTKLTVPEVSVVRKSNSSIFLLAPLNITTPKLCTNSPVFLTPDARSNQKVLYPEALWLTGEPFHEKQREDTFLSQLTIIFQHVKETPKQQLQLLPFEGGAVLLCSPACNHSIVSSILKTFHSLKLSSSAVFLVWNDTVPGGAVIPGESGETDRTSRSRYEDNEELRFSLRSVDEFAPWVRRVHLVTNGQVPAWLRLDHPRLRVVTHEEIFRNASHLPTFNSAAIEMHLHRIPGLARHFIYMNDDVFFGAPIHPDDFFTRARGQRVFLSWAVPNCRPGCPSNWLKDGFCDKGCNFPECEFDAGDCGPDGQDQKASGPHAAAASAWAAVMQQGGIANAMGFGASVPYRPFCHGTCADAWLGDGSCDAPCNRAECAFDAGDCGDRHFTQLCAAPLRNGSWSAELPPGVTEAIVDLRALGPGLTWSHGRFRANSPHSVRSVVLAKKYQTLLILFHRNVNRTEAVLNLEASNNVTRNISLVAHTNGNGSCPVSMLFHRIEPSQVAGESFPTMKPYAPDQRGPKLNAKYPEPPSSETLQRLEEKLWEKVNQNPNSSDSSFLARAAKDLERDWMVGEITEKGYRFFLWKLLSGAPVRVTADRRRLAPSSRRKTPSWQKRRLLDTYAQSLIHSNRLFSRKYGYTPRKVPGHMPHFLDTYILRELESRFSEQWRQTSGHRIRSANDLQYAFSYFYFLMSERVNRTLPEWLSRFDADHSQELNANELRTMSLHLWGLPFDQVKLNETLSNCSVLRPTSRVPVAALVSCEFFHNLSSLHLTNASRFKFEVAGEEAIWFKMLDANYTHAMHHLDEIRTERRKFLCLNDNIDHTGSPKEAAKVRRAMRQLLSLMFPRPSQFELPRGATHDFHYRDAWLRDRQWRRTARTLRVLAMVLLVVLLGSVLFRRQCRKGCLRTFRFLRRTARCGGKPQANV